MRSVVALATLAALLVAAPPAEASRAPAKAGAPPPGSVEEQVEVPLLGTVKVYRPVPLEKAHGVVLFVSGDGGWNLGVVDMARRIAPKSLVVGLSMKLWRKLAEKSATGCWYPAGDAETIAQRVEKRYGFPRYVPPVLVGYSSGATLVYGILAQSPPEAFAGAVSLGFCADLEVARTFCGRAEWKPTYDTKKHKSWLPSRASFSPGPEGAPRWIALQGQSDQVCDPKAVASFSAEVPASRLVPLDKVGHGFSVPRNWGAAFDAAVAALVDPIRPWEPPPRKMAAATPTPTEAAARLDALDLPLELEWPERAEAVVVFVSGDGGWAEIDREVSKALARLGIAVVGWNTLRYFWRARTPEGFHADLARLVEALPELPVFAGGYSFGAEVVPVTLALDGIPRVEGLVLLGPGTHATFEVSPLDWIRSNSGAAPYSVREVLESAAPPAPTLCLAPSSDTESGCPDQDRREVSVVKLPGGHHFAGDFDGVAKRIAAFVAERVASGHRAGSATAAGQERP